MSKIKIMCTSTGCIEYAPQRYRDMDIEIIRVLVYFNGKEYKADTLSHSDILKGGKIEFFMGKK